jgi:hypothetical protein
MTMPRMVGLLLGLATVGVAVVALRLEQAHHMREIQKLQFEQASLRQVIWSQNKELARLRSPQMVRERAVRFGVEASPEQIAPARPSPGRR